tara:strand:+ start:139 stop:351 length:213 start_codon:yes stop_codon:yes gene_type:complete
MAKERKPTSLCFKTESCANLSKIIECLLSELMNIGGSSVGLSKLAKLGSEKWRLDPEGSQFLILVAYLTT